MIMIAMIKKENLRRRYFYFRRNGRVSYFSWKIWSEKAGKAWEAREARPRLAMKAWARDQAYFLTQQLINLRHI